MDPTDDPETVVIPSGMETPAEQCEHDVTTRVGYDGGSNEYYRCSDCEAVLVVPGTPPAASSERDVERSGPSHPLLEGLRLDSNRRDRRDPEPFLDRLRKRFGRR